MIQLFVISIVTSFGVAVGVTALMVRLAPRLGLIDLPNERSSHAIPTPRGGGFGVIAGIAAGTVVFAAAGSGPGRGLVVVLIASASVAAVGALDDLLSLPSWFRLAAHSLVAVGVVIVLGPVGRLPLPAPLDVSVGWLAGPLTVIWLAGVTNFFNFMDGIDGLAGSQAIASCIGVAIAAWSLDAQRLALVLLAGAAGFLIFNRPPAKIFLGDIGSTSIGFAIAAMPLLAPVNDRSMATLAVAIGLSLFLLDPLETLIRLARSGHKVGMAHRLHSYQRLALTSRNPAVVAGGIAVFGMALSIGGGLSYRIAWIFWPLLAVAMCIFVVEKVLADRSSAPPRRWERVGEGD